MPMGMSRTNGVEHLVIEFGAGDIIVGARAGTPGEEMEGAALLSLVPRPPGMAGADPGTIDVGAGGLSAALLLFPPGSAASVGILIETLEEIRKMMAGAESTEAT